MRWIWIERVHIEGFFLAFGGLLKMEFGLVMPLCVIDMRTRSCTVGDLLFTEHAITDTVSTIWLF